MIIQISEADDLRLEPYRFVRERDVAGRGERFIAEGKVVLNCLAKSRDFQAESLLILDSRLAGLSNLLASLPPQCPSMLPGRRYWIALPDFMFIGAFWQAAFAPAAGR